MNRRITHLHLFVLVLFGALIVAVTYWQIWAAPSLATRQANPRLVFRELSVDRGTIATADGVILARNRRGGRTDAPCSTAPTRRTGSPRSGSATRRSPASRAGWRRSGTTT